MGSTGEPINKGIDASVGGLVWVRRRNGSWWPGRILSADELPESSLLSPRSGTPVKLLGREDASVRTLGGRKLWESKDTWKWGHDKFEELTMQERHYEDHRRTSRGRHRGRVRNRGTDLGYTQEQRPKAYNNNNDQNSDNNQSFAPKGVRGRGPQRYQPTFGNNNEGHRARNRLSGKSIKKPSHVSSGRTGVPVSKVEPHANQPRKQVFASNLSIASPPFYPSGSSTKETISSHRRDLQAGISRNVQSSPTGDSFSIAQSTTMLQGKEIVDSIGMNKLYIDGSLSTVAGKPSNTLQVPSSSSSSNNSTQPLPLRSQGRGANSLAQMAYKPVVSNNQVNRVLHQPNYKLFIEILFKVRLNLLSILLVGSLYSILVVDHELLHQKQ